LVDITVHKIILCAKQRMWCVNPDAQCWLNGDLERSNAAAHKKYYAPGK